LGESEVYARELEPHNEPGKHYGLQEFVKVKLFSFTTKDAQNTHT